MIVRELLPADVTSGFTCGVGPLDRYLRKFALPNQLLGVNRCFVLDDPTGPGQVLGYYTLSMHTAAASDLAMHLAATRALPAYPLPVAYIGWFAIAAAQQGEGLGHTLLRHALQGSWSAMQHVGAVGILLDAYDAKARAFYAKFSFVTIGTTDAPFRMFLPQATLASVVTPPASQPPPALPAPKKRRS